jgi:hypothetical protein
VPSAASAVAVITPAAGCTSVASTVTTAGPTTKQTSSTTDSSAYAVPRAGSLPSSALHRARTIEPSDGMDPPATKAAASTAASGARSSAQATNTAVAVVNTAVDGRSTRRWPYRSASRASGGEHTAKPTDPAADARPASPYRPVSAATRSRLPRPNIDIGIRPTAPATQNRSAPGRPSTPR